MTKQWLAHFNDVPIALIACLVFFGTFLFMFIWTFRKDGRAYYQSAAELPMNDGEIYESRK